VAILTLVGALVIATALTLTLVLRSQPSKPGGQGSVGLTAAAVPCVPNAPQPAPYRLAKPEQLNGMYLAVVEPSVQPKLSASAALAKTGFPVPSQHICALRIVLAYFSSPSSGTLRPGCSHAPYTTDPPDCAGINGFQPYSNILAWVYTWRGDCGSSSGPPGIGPSTPTPSPPPYSCATVMVIDASGGQCCGMFMSGVSMLSPSPPPTPPPSTPTVFPIPPGAALINIDYVSRPETAATRGRCDPGFTQVATGAPPDPACVYDGYSSTPVNAIEGIDYLFWLGNLHCGLSHVQFNGRLWVPDDLGGGSGVDAGTDPLGTMTLLVNGGARFIGRSGFKDDLHPVATLRLPACE
jgi:hypothetical protein